MSGKAKRVRGRKSKKGRLAAPRRTELNEGRSDRIVAEAIAAKDRGIKYDTMFARVTGHLGMGRVKAKLPRERDFAEIQVQIPNVFGRKGVTPINSQTIVAVFVGMDFDPQKFDANVHFKMTCILNDRQAGDLLEASVIPSWMTIADTTATGDGDARDGFVFDYSGVKESEESEEGEESEESEESEEEEKAKAKAPAVAPKAKAPAVAPKATKGEEDEEDEEDDEDATHGKNTVVMLEEPKTKDDPKDKTKDKKGTTTVGFDLYGTGATPPVAAGGKAKAKAGKPGHRKTPAGLMDDDVDVDVDAI